MRVERNEEDQNPMKLGILSGETGNILSNRDGRTPTQDVGRNSSCHLDREMWLRNLKSFLDLLTEIFRCPLHSQSPLMMYQCQYMHVHSHARTYTRMHERAHTRTCVCGPPTLDWGDTRLGTATKQQLCCPWIPCPQSGQIGCVF